MAGHLRQHSFTGNTDHDFTGLQPNQLLKLNSSGTAIESFSTASTISLSSITNIDYIDFNTATTATVQTGRLIWNDSDEIGGLEVGMKGGNVTLQVGEENLARVYNDDTVTLTDGMVVYVHSSQGNTISVRRASNTGETTSARVLGVVTEPIAVGDRGFVNTFGLVRDLDTSGYSGGTPLYVGSTAGTFTDVRPTAPNHTCLIGFVSRVSATVGSIFVHISNGWELEELHDVFAPHSALTQNNLLYWDTGNTRWQATGTSALGIVTTTGGTLNYIPKFTSGGINLTNSLISEVGNTISINSSAVTINGGRLYSDGTTALNNAFWAASSSQPTIAGTRNLLLGNNDTGTFSVSGQFNNLIGSFNSISLTSGQQNSIIGSYNSLAGLTTGSYNIGINSSFASNVSGSLAIGSFPDASNSVYIGGAVYYYPNWYLGLGKSATFTFGTTNMNWYASSVAEGDADKNATIPIWRFNGSRATGSGSSGDIRFAVSLSATTGTGWTTPTDVITVQGNSGFVGIGISSPQEKLHVSGNFRVNDILSTYGAGKLAVSDANGTISFSSTTALGLATSAGTVNKYSTTLTTPTAGATNTITHNLGTTDITVTLWLVTTGDMTSARITNRQTNSVDVIFAAAPGENVRVVITG